MVILGIILLLIGLLVAHMHLLVTLGIVLILAGLILNLVPIGGTTRRWY